MGTIELLHDGYNGVVICALKDNSTVATGLVVLENESPGGWKVGIILRVRVIGSRAN